MGRTICYQKITCLDLERIAGSGQCFRWRRLDPVAFLEERGAGLREVPEEVWKIFPAFPEGILEAVMYEIPAFHRKLQILQKGEDFLFFCSGEEFESLWRSYLDLDGPYEAWLDSVPGEDVYLTRAAAYGRGIRILRQDPWETAVSFLISQCNNIPRIRGCIEKLCRNFGDEGYHFPDAKRLAGLEGEELERFQKGCSLGYRDQYILSLAKRVASGDFSLEACGALPYEACVKELKTLSGVGQKVADCMALFGFHKTDAFPIDVHMKDILYAHYYSPELEGLSGKKQLERMVEQHFSRYRGYRGIVQQWMFAAEINA